MYNSNRRNSYSGTIVFFQINRVLPGTFSGGKENPYVELYTLQPHGKTEEPFRMPERERERVFGLFSGH